VRGLVINCKGLLRVCKGLLFAHTIDKKFFAYYFLYTGEKEVVDMKKRLLGLSETKLAFMLFCANSIVGMLFIYLALSLRYP